jgi:hypothetical protein
MNANWEVDSRHLYYPLLAHRPVLFSARKPSLAMFETHRNHDVCPLMPLLPVLRLIGGDRFVLLTVHLAGNALQLYRSWVFGAKEEHRWTIPLIIVKRWASVSDIKSPCSKCSTSA